MQSKKLFYFLLKNKKKMFKLRSLSNTSKRICNLKRLNVSPFISQRSFAIQTTVPVKKKNYLIFLKKKEEYLFVYNF